MQLMNTKYRKKNLQKKNKQTTPDKVNSQL